MIGLPDEYEDPQPVSGGSKKDNAKAIHKLGFQQLASNFKVPIPTFGNYTESLMSRGARCRSTTT